MTTPEQAITAELSTIRPEVHASRYEGETLDGRMTRAKWLLNAILDSIEESGLPVIFKVEDLAETITKGTGVQGSMPGTVKDITPELTRRSFVTDVVVDQKRSTLARKSGGEGLRYNIVIASALSYKKGRPDAPPAPPTPSRPGETLTVSAPPLWKQLCDTSQWSELGDVPPPPKRKH